MARQKLTASVSITVNGETIRMLTIGEDGQVVYALPKEKIIEYDRMMLKNIARTESNYLSRRNSL